MKAKSSTILIAVSLGLTVFLSKGRAVSPPPDGCYPNFTTAEGCDALSLLTTGAGNTAIGWRSLFLDTTGNFNTGVGGGALVLNNADSNTAVGAAALLLNTSGTENTATGTDALVFNDMGQENTANGAFALFNNTNSNLSTATGSHALYSQATGFQNTAYGAYALYSIDGPSSASNTAIGLDAAFGLTSGQFNTVVGAMAGNSFTSGNFNIIISGAGLTTGDFNINIGASGPGAESGTIRIGNNNHTACHINGIEGTAVTGTAVVVNSSNQLGVAPSSQRFKTEIKGMDKTSEAIFALKPVTFRYKKELDPDGIRQFGLVAEDVEKVNPDLVAHDRGGKPYTVRYEAVNAMLLNEFLKEYRKVEEQQAAITKLNSIIAQLQKEFRVAIEEQRKQFETRLRKQEAKLRSVNDRIELNRTAQQNIATSN